MSVQPSNAQWVVWISLLVAAILSIVTLPIWLSVARPLWVPMVVVYWVLVMPNRFGLIFAFSVGILLDVLLGFLLGVNAICLMLLAFVTLTLHRRLRMFPMWQQTFVVFVLINCHQLLYIWAKSIMGLSEPSLWYLFPSVSSAVLWPLVFASLTFIRSYFKVS
ncbi:MAG: rod shape-determining protein MreD [Candidatus Endonucleobacter sp. (ex Gigantidas childressi)]|nr:rod shape-determining protein MreD [Candidatus Endonucleobacter sp. (ex Gigantidas childressi)]